jgi:hypothetical protein
MDDIKSALVNAGYRCSAFHKEPSALKTDAPNHVGDRRREREREGSPRTTTTPLPPDKLSFKRVVS